MLGWGGWILACVMAQCGQGSIGHASRLAMPHALWLAASDVWSFGVLLWELTSFAKTPYGAIGASEVVAELDKGYRLPQPPACPAAMYACMSAHILPPA